MKGAVEVILARCTSGTTGAAEANAQMAARGLRVLAVAVGKGTAEENLELRGLIGIADPPRTEAIEAVAAARAAGITTVMITGDHPTTAQVIARELGIVRPGEPTDELVHARATPEDKLKIVRAWKKRDAVVAMTGDGVNDAPELREAHIGICMGKTGTEVTREAADMVLTDDNFASIVAAVREGRGIFDNIRKSLVYLLSGTRASWLEGQRAASCEGHARTMGIGVERQSALLQVHCDRPDPAQIGLHVERLGSPSASEADEAAGCAPAVRPKGVM